MTDVVKEWAYRVGGTIKRLDYRGVSPIEAAKRAVLIERRDHDSIWGVVEVLADDGRRSWKFQLEKMTPSKSAIGD